MALTHPDKIANSLDLLVMRTIPALVSEYRHAYHYSFDRRDRPSLTVEEVEAGEGKRSARPASDPTGQIVVEQTHVRNVLRSSGKRIDTGVKKFSSILGELQTLFEDQEYAPLRGIMIPSTASQAQLRVANEAKRRRDIFDEIDRHERAIRELKDELRSLVA